MQGLQLWVLLIQSINLIITIVLFIFFYIRLSKIKPMSITNKYLGTSPVSIDKFWLIRFLSSVVYILISAAMLILELAEYLHASNLIQQLFMSGSIGFSINCLIIVMHIVVVSQQLKKEQPFTKLHQVFLAYLVCISTTRLALAVIDFTHAKNDPNFSIVELCLAICLDLVSCFMLSFWFKKKKISPSFDDLSKYDINAVTQRITSPPMYDRLMSSNLKIPAQKWNLITPSIAMETGKVRIILQTYTYNQILRSLANEQTKQLSVPEDKKKQFTMRSAEHKRSIQHLEIISDQLYTVKEIKKIYLACCRFNIQTKISFEGESMANFFREVKKFVEELFTIKQAYVPEIYDLFSIPKQSVDQLNLEVSKLIKMDSELLVSTYVDHNALFLSIEIFKHFWVDDHYIFYMQALTMDERESSVSYKRYSDFQEFHRKLEEIVTDEHKSQYKLAHLPKKHFFAFRASDDDKATQRRKQLQEYCADIFNDYLIMTKMPRARQHIFIFLGLQKAIQITISRKPIQFYTGLEIKKGEIYKGLVQQQYITFYQFELYRNGILIRSIYKRFRDFIHLQNIMQHWMHNNQIVYKLITLPQKHLFKSQTKRHKNLLEYLQNVLSVKDVYRIYGVNMFFGMGEHCQDNSLGMSVIKRSHSDCDNSLTQKKCDFSSTEEKMRMSLLIEELGEDR